MVKNQRHSFDSLVRKIPWRRAWQPTAVFLLGEPPWTEKPGGLQSMGSQRVGSDTTERLHFHFSLSCIGEGNGNPLQCSCLENPRDGGASWAAVYGVARSWTQLKQFSSSSSSTGSISFLTCFQIFKDNDFWTSLVVQWLRIHLPMQGSWVPSLVEEDSTCCRATKPVSCN